MQYHLEVKQANAAPFFQPFEQTVARIGSSEAMSIVVSDLPMHAFTIVRGKKNDFSVINRAAADLYIGRRRIPIGEQRAWESTKDLKINGRLSLRIKQRESQSWPQRDAIQQPIPGGANRSLMRRVIVAVVLGIGIFWYAFHQPQQVISQQQHRNLLMAALDRVRYEDESYAKARRFMQKAEVRMLMPGAIAREQAADALTDLHSLFVREQRNWNRSLARNMNNYLRSRMKSLQP